MGQSFDIGRDSGTPIIHEYKHCAEFTGIIKKVRIDLAGAKHIDSDALVRKSFVEE